MKHGWFEIAGEQEGDRTLGEQMLGLEPALKACAGKTVLDLGCAEGCIGRAFLDRGARAVIGIDSNPHFLATARRMNVGITSMRFILQDLNVLGDSFRAVYGADIVLALAILHKLPDPGSKLEQLAAMTRERLVIRLAAGSTGVISHKYGRGECDSHRMLDAHGFRLDESLLGPRGELVQHWVR